MSNGERQRGSANVVQTIVDNLGAMFRHLFPGVLIVGGSYLTHPGWFGGRFNIGSWQQLLVLAVIALTIGNCWFAVNRYTFHQIIDLVLYWSGKGIPKQTDKAQFRSDLGHYVNVALSSDIPQRARQHIAFRASSVLLLYTIGELGVLLSVWPGESVFFHNYRCWILASSGIVLLLGGWQELLTLSIDREVTSSSATAGRSRPESARPR